MRQTARLTALLLRAYVRDRIALFFSLIVPLMLMVIFGYLNLGEFGRVSLAIDDQAKNSASDQLTTILKGIDTLDVTESSTDAALTKLRRTELDMLVVIPVDFAIAPARPGQTVPQVTVYGDDARPQQVAVGRQIIASVIDRISFAVTQTAPVVGVKDESVQGVRLRYVDFLVPGILGVNIMQLAVFSVAFALAGWAQTENQVPAIAQLITLPQFFFSGVFFSKNAAPEVIRPITNLLPLTFLNDALREISVQGASLWDVRTQIAGLIVWIGLGFLLAVRLFRFERF